MGSAERAHSTMNEDIGTSLLKFQNIWDKKEKIRLHINDQESQWHQSSQQQH